MSWPDSTGFYALNDHNSRPELNQAGVTELVQRIVNRGQGHRDARCFYFRMQAFSGDMAVASLEQHARQGDPLAGRPQARSPQTVGEIGGGSAHRRRHM
jgi:hypothetical protein